MAEIIRTPAFEHHVRQIWLPKRAWPAVGTTLGVAIEQARDLNEVDLEALGTARGFVDLGALGIEGVGLDGVVLRGAPAQLDRIAPLCVNALEGLPWARITEIDMTLEEYMSYAVEVPHFPLSLYCDVTPESSNLLDHAIPPEALIFDAELQKPLTPEQQLYL